MACLGTSLQRSTRLLGHVSRRSACNSPIWNGWSLLSTAWDTDGRFEWSSYPKGPRPCLEHVWGQFCSRSTREQRPARRLYAPFVLLLWRGRSIAGDGIYAVWCRYSLWSVNVHERQRESLPTVYAGKRCVAVIGQYIHRFLSAAANK